MTLDTLITRQPTLMELSVKRMIFDEERKSNIWLFLKDYPRYQGSMLSAFAGLYVAFRLRNSNLTKSDRSSKLRTIASKVMSIFMTIFVLFLAWLNFFLV